MPDNVHHQFLRIDRRRIVGLLVILVLLYLVVPQFVNLHSGVTSLNQVIIGWVVLALAAIAGSYILTTLIYCLLSKHRLRFTATLLVQGASTFANRILPAGTGAIAVNYKYLRQRQHTTAEATAVVVLNNMLGSVGHFLLLAAAFLINSEAFAAIHISYTTPMLIGVLVAGALILTAGLVWMRKLRVALARQFHQVTRSLLRYRKDPIRLLLALFCSLLMTSLYVACLWACAQAFGVSLSAVQALLVLSAGVFGATVAPTPGGIVGAEAALAGSLVALGVPFSVALPVALLYRLITYWFMLALGAGAFIAVERKHYLG